MHIIKNFGIGTILLGFALILPDINTMFINFTEFSPTQLSLIIVGVLMVAFHYFIQPAFKRGY